MNIVLWVVQILLAAAFLAHGLMLLFPPASLLDLINASMGRPLRFIIGVAEVLAASGLTLPGITRFMPTLVAWAAAGLIPIMIGATVFHIQRNEISSACTTFILLVLATFVAYMRWKVLPIRPRTVA
jgi:putative oxidoreductase